MFFFTEKPKLPVDFEEKTWSKLKEAVKAVHEKRRIEYSLEELYRVSLITSPLEIIVGLDHICFVIGSEGCT